MDSRPRYIERDGTVFREWSDATIELGPGEQAIYFQLREAEAERDRLREALARAERFIQRPHYGPKRFFLLMDVQKALEVARATLSPKPEVPDHPTSE